MSSSTEVPQVQAVSAPALNPYSAGAVALMEQARAMRQQVPNFTFPEVKGAARRLSRVSSLPAPFVELTHAAVTLSAPLVRQGAPDPVQNRDLMLYADAYAPFADELEALAQFVRHSIAVAKSKVGRDALTTYALAKVLAKVPETADLLPHVEDMGRALGRKRSRKAKAQPAPDAPVTLPK